MARKSPKRHAYIWCPSAWMSCVHRQGTRWPRANGASWTRSFPCRSPSPIPDRAAPNWFPFSVPPGGRLPQAPPSAAMPARHDAGIYAESDLTNDSRLVGRSAWNTEWMLIIPGGTLLNDPNAGLDAFIATVDDIKLYFQTYSYAGD